MIRTECRMFKSDILKLISQAEKRTRDLEDRVREDKTRFDLSLSRIDGKLENHRSAILTVDTEITEIMDRIKGIERKIGENEPENRETKPDFEAIEAENERLRSVISGLLDQLEAKEVAIMDAMDEIDHLKAEIEGLKTQLNHQKGHNWTLVQEICRFKKNENPEKFFPTHGGAEDAD